MIRMTRPAVAGLMLAAALGACKKTDTANGNVDTTAAAAATATPTDTTMKPADTTAAAGAMTTTPGASKWTSPTVLGYAWAANTGEIALGKLAETKATNADVKAFARMMVTDHTKMLSETKSLVNKLKVTADTTADDVKDQMKGGQDALTDLTGKAKGADWDKDYIDKMVDGHQKVLGELQDAAKNTTDPELTKALEATTAKVQAHLTKAQDIQSRLK